MEKLTMATPAKVISKSPSLQQRIAARQQKRVELGKEAQVRVAAAYTISKTMLPTAPSSVRQHFASILLAASTKELKVALRQTAINAHNTKLAETLKAVHKVELNQLMEASGDLEKAKNEVKSELKGDAKSATTKTADDRKDAGPQPAKYDEGNRKEPSDLDAENAGKREAETVDKTEGGEKIQDAVQDSARVKEAGAKKADIMGGAAPAPSSAPSKPAVSTRPSIAPSATSNTPPSAVSTNKAEIRAAAKKACSCGKAGCEKCSNSKESASDGKPNEGEVLQTKSQTASKSKKADEPMPPGGPAGSAEAMPPPESPEGMDMPENGGEGEGPAAAEGLEQDDTKAVLLEKVQEAEQAVQAIEQEITAEETEEVDLSGLGDDQPVGEQGPEENMDGVEEPVNMQDIYSTANLTDKASSLANEHHDAADEDYFGPSASSELEASLDEPQMASLEEMFSHSASADSMDSLFEKSASNVEGFEVVPSSTGEAANKFKAEHGSDDRDTATDHDKDILSILVEGLDEQEDGQERVKQDATPELEAPAATKEASKKPALKHIKASSGVPASANNINIADMLFASIDAIDEDRNTRGTPIK
jgi:hypothetical protein